MRSRVSVLLATVVLLVVPATASAHSEITSTKPEQGTRVASAPQRVAVRFSEPPSDVRIRVVDGCGDKVSRGSAITGSTATTRIAEAAGGRWKVVVKTISSADDHLVTERFGFRVAGKSRCGEQVRDPDPSPTETPGGAAGGSGQDADASEASGGQTAGSGSTIVAIVAGVVVVLGAAGVMTRRKRT